MTPGEQAVENWNDADSQAKANELAADIDRRERAGMSDVSSEDEISKALDG
jgi:hypothetical protein